MFGRRLKCCSSLFIPRVKYSDTNPQATPRNKYQGIRPRVNASMVVSSNIGVKPVVKYAMAVAVTDEMSSGAMEFIVMSIIRTSNVNTRPAIGALNMPPIAPAAPQPIISIIVFWSRWKSLARLEPIAAPVSTIGASAPTEPPKPMVMPLPMRLDQVLCGLMIDLRCEIANRIFVIPWDISSRTTYRTNSAARAMPIIGHTISHQ